MKISRLRIGITMIAVLLSAVIFAASGLGVSAQMNIFKMFSEQATPTPSPSPSPTPAASATPTPTPIALADVVEESQTTEARIVEIKRDISEESAVGRTRRSLQLRQNALADAERRTREKLDGVPSLDTISELEREWQSYQSSVSAWQSNLKEIGVEIDNHEKELTASLTAWKALQAVINKPTKPEERAAKNKQLEAASKPAKTEKPTPETAKSPTPVPNAAPVTEEAIPEEVPPAIRGRISQTIADIEKAQKAVLDAKTELLDLQTKISKYEGHVSEMLALIDERRNQALSNLVSQDSPPLWELSRIKAVHPQEVGDTLSGELSASGDYLSRSLPTFIFVFLFFCISLLVLFRIRRRTKVLVKEEPDLERVLVFFEKPFTSAFFLSMVMLSLSYEKAPQILGVVVLAGLLVPGYMILRRVLDPPLFPILNALVAFYYFDAVRLVFDGYPFLSRLLFSVQMLAAVVLVTWLYKRKPSGVGFLEEHAGFVSALRKVIRLTAIPFGLAVLANVFGFVGLSRIVARAVLDSAYSGLFFYAFYLIFVSFVVYLLRVRPFSRLKMVQNNRLLIVRKISRVMQFFLILLWSINVLNLLFIEEWAVRSLSGFLGLKVTLGEFSIAVSDVVLFLFIVWLAFAISRLVRFVLQEDVYTRVSLSDGVPYAISTILHYLLLVAGFTLAILSLGIDLTKFTILAGAFGVGLGFGLQNVVENFVSGVILLFERPVTVGDVIQRGDQIGDLRRIGLRASVLGTPEGAEVIVPNGHLLSEEVTNWTPAENRRRLDINVGVAYGSDPEEVMRLLESVGKSHESVIDVPEPVALFVGFGDSALNFQLRAWADSESKWWLTRSDLNLGVYKALTEAGIEIPFPQRDVFIKNADKFPPQSGGGE